MHEPGKTAISFVKLEETISDVGSSKMPPRKDVTLIFVQTTMFTTDTSAFTSGKAVGIILKNFQDRFDGEMQVLPLPAEVPPEIHRVVLQSSDNRWRLSMAPARIDSVWQNPVEGSTVSLQDAALECAEVQEEYLRETDVRVGRVSLVVHRVWPVDNPPPSAH